MSSPDGLQYSQADFLARWMPSSHRAGVILNPSTDLAGALRHISPMGSSPMKPDDSFTSDFAPLPASADSSCVDVAHPSLGTDRPGDESQDLSLQVKLEQLRKWQQHMQEQLKTQQLEELLRLQAEQQRLLGRINGAQQCTEDDAGSSASPPPERPEWPPPKHPTEVDNYSKEEDTLDSSYDQLEDTNTSRHFQQQENTSPPSSGTALANNQRRGDSTVSQERPIKPGIGGYTKTFEELLEEQLMLEDQRQKAAQQQQNQGDAGQAPPKRPFLKRGEGLSRFTNKGRASFPKKDMKTDSKPPPQARVMSRSNSEPTAIQRAASNCVQKLPVQRKTAVLNKENRLKGLISPPLNLRNEAKAARTILGSHQRLNTEGSGSAVDSRQTKQFPLQRVKDQTNRTGGPSAQLGRRPGPNDTKPNPVTKQVVVLGEQGSSKNSGLDVETAEQRRGAGGGGGGDEGSVDSFELSFQEKLRQWECHRQLENVELGEFELLEQAADELSFSSNSSFVMKILQIDQHHKKAQAAEGLHQRRLSSTPIKSPPTKTLQRSSSSSDGSIRRSSSINSEASQRSEDTERQEDTEREAGRKISISSCVESEIENQEAVAALFPVPSERPYNKWTYQNKDGSRDSGASQDGDEERDSVISNPDESTLMEDEEAEQGGVVFDDDDTWNDVEETQLHRPADSGRSSPVLHPTAVSVSPPTQTLVRKVAVNRNVAFSNQEPNPPSPPPPASQLMTKLFPSLNPKAQNAPLHPTPASSVAPQSEKQQNETNQQIQSKQLRERLVELEIEIDRFKKENAALAKLRQENEKNQENLRKECLEFEKTRSMELSKFEEYKKEETRKLQKERKLFEKHVAAARAIPDKKEREEIQALKQQLSSLQEELRRKESRWASMHNRQRQQIDSLSQENSSLREEIRVLEKLRLSTLRKTSTSVGTEKETKDGPRMFPNLPTTVTKGVKFASPLDSRGSGSNSSPPQTSSAAAATCKRSTAESSQPASGIKSSLRRSSGPSILSSSSSSSMPGRRTEEKSTSASKSLEKPQTQEQSRSCSPKEDFLPSEPECSTAEDVESVQELFTFPDGKVEKVLTGGDRMIIFPNGTKKEVSADGLSVKVTFFNGDTKQIKADQTVIYHYSEAQTTHITYPDGLEVLHFPNNQTEKHFPDGRKEITFPDQTVKNLFPDGREESVLMDGTIIQVNPDGTKEIHFNTGQKEVHTPDYKRREYPDGTVKTVYADGRQETRYPTGRVRIKDKDGNVIMDNSV